VKRAPFIGALASFSILPRFARAATVFDRVEAIARSVPGVVGAYCRTLADAPPVFEFNETLEFPAASTIKMLILVTAYRAEEAQPGALDEVIVTHRSDLIAGSDFMSKQPDGARFTVRQLLVPMITLSDNTASNDLISHFGFEAINATAAAAGMASTRLARHFLDYNAIVKHNDNITTPRDMGSLLYQIAFGARESTTTIASPEHCKAMIATMLGQTDRDAIPAGLPRTVQVANKTGAIDGTRNDVAIVEPFRDSPYVITVYSKWVTDYAAVFTAWRRLARLSYQLAGASGE
jgi:beta-lactamase class A